MEKAKDFYKIRAEVPLESYHAVMYAAEKGLRAFIYDNVTDDMDSIKSISKIDIADKILDNTYLVSVGYNPRYTIKCFYDTSEYCKWLEIAKIFEHSRIQAKHITLEY